MTTGAGVAMVGAGTVHTGALAMVGVDIPITIGDGTTPGDGTAGAGVATTVVGTVHIGAGAMPVIGAGEAITITVGDPITIIITTEETMPSVVDVEDIPLPQYQVPHCGDDPTWPQEQVDTPQGTVPIVVVPIDLWVHPERLDHITVEQRPEEMSAPTPLQETEITGPVEVPVLLPTTVIVPETTDRTVLHHHPEAIAPIAGVET